MSTLGKEPGMFVLDSTYDTAAWMLSQGAEQSEQSWVVEQQPGVLRTQNSL
jgi:hypothetical protein